MRTAVGATSDRQLRHVPKHLQYFRIGERVGVRQRHAEAENPGQSNLFRILSVAHEATVACTSAEEPRQYWLCGQLSWTRRRTR